MTIDVPVDSPKGNVLNYSAVENDDEKYSNAFSEEPSKVPLVVLRKIDNVNYVVSPRTSNRTRKIKQLNEFETDFSNINLKWDGNESTSPKKRSRSRNLNGDCDMISPKKVPKTNSRSAKEEIVDTLCSKLTNSVNIATPVKRSLTKTDLSALDLTGSTCPKKKVTERTPIKKTPTKRTLRKTVSGSPSPMDTDDSEFVSGKHRATTPSKFHDDMTPLKSVKINLDESFRRSVLRCNLENVGTSPENTNSELTPRRSTRKRTPSKFVAMSRKSTRQSSYAPFYYDSDSDDDKMTKHHHKVNSVRKRLESESNPCEIDAKSQNVQVKTPSRRKQALQIRKELTPSESEESQHESHEITKSIKIVIQKKDILSYNAMQKSPESKPHRETAPKTPKTRKSLASTPQSIKAKATPKTPKNRLKLLREGVITPSMHSRSSIIPGDSTPLMMARSQLHVSYVPTSLPCREREYLDVYNFLKGKLDDGCGGCMYISGVPGTGKTATVTSVISSLQSDKRVSKFSFVNVNGMRLTEPRQSYVEIWKQLTGKTVPWEQAQSLLEERFTKKKNTSPVVMLIDELDILCTKRQDVVYNLLDWPTKSKDQLIVITIANTMDLPERLLMSRVTSRLGLTRLTFQAYTHKQLMEIVTKRLTGTDSFKSDAIQLVARKVASVSGDARRALDICRRAAEIAEEESQGQMVNITHINEALNAMITQPQVTAIRRCSRLQKLMLQAIVAEIERTGVEETAFCDVYKTLVSCCALDGFKMASCTAAMRALSGLSAYRLIISDQKCSNIYQRIILNVSVHDVYFALKNE